jgi:hypothetical protein
MFIVYAEHLSSRLEYILKFVLTEQLGINFQLTNDKTFFTASDVPKLNYSKKDLHSSFQVIPEGLLSESAIRSQKPDIFIFKNYPAFFSSSGTIPFDIFSASFYLISRYEEYMPYEPDMYGRYPHTSSLAFKNNFINFPLVNIWISFFEEELQNIFPSLVFKPKKFDWFPTYDIDIAYSYKHKGIKRTLGGFLKAPTSARLNVLINQETDPFDCYEFLHGINKGSNTQPIYFFLVAEQTSKYDKNISPSSDAMRNLIREHSQYQIGIHPSWRSFTDPDLIKREKEILEEITGTKTRLSRQHYIKMYLPATYEYLIAAGIQDDYSMGYGSINGFRASVASSFYWYDLIKEKQTSLRIHPFCFMDANSYFEQKQTPSETLGELTDYHNISIKYADQMITIFHNNILGTDPKFSGWREMYQQFTSRFQQ